MNVRVPDVDNPLKLAVLISGGGRTMVNLHEQMAARSMRATISTVISSRADAKGVDRARHLGLPTQVITRKDVDDIEFQESLTAAVADADLVCMAGFLSLWMIPNEMLGRVVNIHPALLPDFGGKGMYGMRVHQAVIEAGVRESGCTIHYCDNEYDHGPIILQRRVEVSPDESPQSLADRVFAEECQAYPDVIQQFCNGTAPKFPNQ